MPYIGQGIKQGTFKVLDTSGNTYNGSNTTFSLGTQVGSAAQLLVSHDGVIQKPGTDYTLASGGASITFSTAPASGASIFITEISGAVGGTVTPSDTSVTADKLNTALLTGQTDIGADIADADLFLVDDGAGGTLRKTAASRIKTYVGGFDVSSITGATALTETPAGTDEFVFSDNGTLKRVDFSLMNNSPIFYAHNQNSQTISNNTHTVVQFDTDSATGDFDPDSKFDTSNYRFTPGISGYYLLYTQIALYDNNDFDNFRCTIRKNGGAIVRARIVHRDNGTINAMTIVNSDTNDYFDCEVYHDKGSNLSLTTGYENTYFTGFKVV